MLLSSWRDSDMCSLRVWMIGTQEDQDQTDEKARRKATNDLVQSWMDRLQLISVFASREGIAISLAALL